MKMIILKGIFCHRPSRQRASDTVLALFKTFWRTSASENCDFVMTLRFTKQAPAAPQLNYNTNICLGANRNFGYFEASVYNASYRIYMLHLDEIQDDCLFRTLVARVCFGMSSS